jgi:glycosyltransferase involved in cell wall biosynthesis
MRIIYFYQYFTTPKGSYNTRVYEFTRRWVKAGDSVTVVTGVFDRSDLRPNKFLSRYHIDGIDVRVINFMLSNKHGVLRRLFSFAEYGVVASWYAATIPADVVIVSSPPLTVGIPGLVARYLRRIPLVFEVRDLWAEGAIQMGYLTNPVLVKLARAFESCCYRAATEVVALSDGIAEWIRRAYGIERITVVPNAADNALFEKARSIAEPPDWAGRKRLVVYAGNLGPGDDCSQVLEMARYLQADSQPGTEIEVVVIGDGKQGPMLRQRAADQKLPVRFLGLMPREKLITFLTRAECAVFATRSLPFYDTCSPNKLFDAMAAGVPVVQTTQGWIKELFEREQCGVTVPQNDPAAFAGAVLKVINDHELRSRLAGNGMRVAREKFDREILSSRMHAAVLEAAGRRMNEAAVAEAR